MKIGSAESVTLDTAARSVFAALGIEEKEAVKIRQEFIFLSGNLYLNNPLKFNRIAVLNIAVDLAKNKNELIYLSTLLDDVTAEAKGYTDSDAFIAFE